MIDLLVYDKDPKLSEPWKSLRYRKFITRKYKCYCGKELIEQAGKGLHHHRNSGGRKNPNDQLLTRCCPTCHEIYHNSPEKFYTRHGTSKDGVTRECARMLLEYVFDLEGEKQAINILAEIAKGLEK